MGEEASKKKKIITALALGQLIAAIVLLIYGAFSRKFTGTKADIMVAVSLLIFWVLMDIVEPLALKRFTQITPERKNAYWKFIILDLAGLAGLAYFLYSMGRTGNNAVIGAVVYALCIKFKRENQDIFYGEDSPGEP